MSVNYSLDEKILREYEKINNEHANFIKSQTDTLYQLFPEVKFIDDKIASLAVTHASRILSEGISPEEAVESVNKEKQILLDKRTSILDGANYKPVEIAYKCIKCKDTGKINGEKCECYYNIMKKILLSQIDGSKTLSFNLEDDTFDNFSLDWYSSGLDPKLGVSPREVMRSVYINARQFCDNFKTSNQNLYFCGSSGTGKTFLASCIANDLIRKGYSVVYQSAYKLFQFMEDYKFCRIDRSENNDIYDSIYNDDLLIIDDLGTEFNTAYTCSVLFDILNTRILNEKSTIISSNLSLNTLEKKYTDRVASRIIGNFEVMRFLGDDIRIAKSKSRG